MANHRLPEVNGDEGTWGTILNDFLTNEHYNNDNAGVGTADSGGHQHITVRAGTTAAGSAPIKLTSGPLMSTSEAGAVEFLSDNLYFTQTTGRARKAVATYYNDANGATGDMYYRDGDGNFARIPIGPANSVLSSSNGIPIWASNAPSGDTINNLDGGSAISVYGGALAINGGGA